MLVTQNLISGDVAIILNCEDCGVEVHHNITFKALAAICTINGIVELKKHLPESYYCASCLNIQKEAAGN